MAALPTPSAPPQGDATEPRPAAPGLLTVLGPGLLVAATGVGAGDLITGGLAGSEVGVVLVWAPLVGALLKWTLNEGLARWQLATGTTLLSGWCTHLGPVFRWGFGAYLLLWSFVVGGAMVNACGVAGAALLPFGDPASARVGWGVAHSLVGLALVRRGGFRLFEGAMSAAVALMFLGVLATAAWLLVDAGPVARGALGDALLHPSLPADAGGRAWLVGVLGGVGGTVTLLCYGYWMAEHRRRGAAGLRTCRLDLGVCYLLTGLFGAAMIVIGAQVPMQGSGSGVAVELAAQLGARFGEAGRVVFLAGFWAAVFSSLLGVWQGVPYLFADFVGGGRGVDTTSPVYRGSQLALALVPLPLLVLSVRSVQLGYTVLGALFMPLLAATLLVLNNRTRLVGVAFRNGPLVNLGLAATLALFVLIGWEELRDVFA